MFTAKIPQPTQHLMGLLAAHVPDKTYLAGGTALTLHLNHRTSVDLDLYTAVEFSTDEYLQRWEKYLPQFQLTQTAWLTILGFSQGVEVSLFYYQYPLIEPTVPCLGLEIASVEDIAAMKLEAIGSRGKKRDFFDLYTICQLPGWSLQKVFDLDKQKYQRNESNFPHIMTSLTYFVDAETTPERAQILDSNWEQVKAFFIQETPKITNTFQS